MPFIKNLNRSEHRTRHHFPKMSRQCRQTQFLFTAGFGNEMKLKSRLPPFSLNRIWCQRTFCLRLRSRLYLSKFWYTRTVRLGTLGCFRFHVWDRVLCRLTGNYHWSVYAISRWPDWYGDRLFFQIQVCKDSVQINHCASEFYSQSQGATDLHLQSVTPTRNNQRQKYMEKNHLLLGISAVIGRYRPHLMIVVIFVIQNNF